MIVLYWSALATAAELFAGVDPGGIELLEEPVYLEEPSGWTARVGDDWGGRVRIAVHRDEEDAAAHLASLAAASQRQLPPLPLGADEARGDGARTLLARQGNIVLSVQRPAGGAIELGRLLLAGVQSAGAWPKAPEPGCEDGELRLAGDWARVVFHHPPVLDPMSLRPREVRLVPTGPQQVACTEGLRRVEIRAWDAYGRGVSALWEPAAAALGP